MEQYEIFFMENYWIDLIKAIFQFFLQIFVNKFSKLPIVKIDKTLVEGLFFTSNGSTAIAGVSNLNFLQIH